ncbi:murein biosynthesis integral membrane protein MurJ [Tenggerimyces flavus]|uniref:Lipid II flippase n=1 Tax=Tenggerimyces flavus TaxID=1708749 RepID=A0ABV7YMF7_9ACTN|nr:murein biosynthesis integral membrane protein MurJ [Tenggerimyces flavus]MBM7789682.1 putative peptidoglycan lipid II flippase [Tenggerimyces flavus]
MSEGRRRIVRSSALLIGLVGLSQVLGFVRDAVVAAVFGASAGVDAYLVAQGLMNLVLGLVASALAKALVPPVSRAADAGQLEEGHRTVRVVLTVAVVVLVAGSVLMAIGANLVIAVLAPGFDAATAEQAVQLARIVLVATVFVAGTNILAAAAQASGRFFWSGLQGIPFNLAMIAAAALLAAEFGVAALAIGFVVGSALRFAVQLPAARRIGLKLRPSLRLSDRGFREVVALAPALLVGSAVTNVNTLVDRAVGSAQGAGTIASLSYGWRIVTLAEVLLVAAFAATLYPRFSAIGDPARRAELRGAAGRALTVVLLVIGPVVGMLTVAAEPIVVVLFGRGNFDAHAIELTALAVSVYAVGLPGLAAREVVARICLAVGDSRTPVLAAVVAMAVNVAGDLTLGVRYGVAGLAASTSLSLVLGAVLLGVLTARRHRALGLRPIALDTARLAGAVAGSALAAWAMLQLLPGNGPTSASGAMVALIAAGTTCLAVYTGLILLLRVTAVADLKQAVSDLLRRNNKS